MPNIIDKIVILQLDVLYDLPQKEQTGAGQNCFFDVSYFVKFSLHFSLATWAT